MKALLYLVIFLKSFVGFAQENYGVSSQKDRLRQYSGQWVSAMNPSTDSVAKLPEIKMSSLTNFNNHSLTVEVFQKTVPINTIQSFMKL